MAKSILMLFSLIMLVSSALGAQYLSHNINVLIPTYSNPIVTEDYLVKFNSSEIKALTSVSPDNLTIAQLIKLGTGPSFKLDVKDYHVSYTVGDAGFVKITLQYSPYGLLHKVEDKGSIERDQIIGTDMVFQSNNQFSLPMTPATTLTIQFPKMYRVAAPPRPSPTSQRVIAQLPGYLGEFYEYTWKGPISSDMFKLVFDRPKVVQRQFTFEGLFEDFMDKMSDPLYVLAILIILGLAVMYRKAIIDLAKEVFAEDIADEEEDED